MFDTIVKVGKVMNPFPSLVVDEQPKPEPSPLGPGVYLRVLHIVSVLQDWRTIHEYSSSIHSYPDTYGSHLEVFIRTKYLDNMPEGYSLALAVHNYRRLILSHGLYSYILPLPLSSDTQIS